MRAVCIIPALAPLISLGGCTTVKDLLPDIYRIDIDQGNIISQEMIDQLEPGMTERQVLFVMGSPLIIDVFHQNRWDYLYSENPGDGGSRTQKRISLFFDNSGLAAMQGDFKPDNVTGFTPTKDTTVIVPKIVREKTLGEKIRALIGLEEK